LYFTSHLEEPLFEQIKQNRVVVSRIRTLKELNLEFRPYEQQTFILDHPVSPMASFWNFYAPAAGGARAMECALMANKLLTLCVTLNEYPCIRYSRTTPNAETVANKLQEKLDRFRRQPGTDWRPNEDQQATLLIVDRSVDPLSPLMHEYTYQAMIMDLLGIENDRYTHEVTTGGGESQRQDVLLNETDPLWAKLRHLFIADASSVVSEEFKEFMAKNKTADFARKGGGGGDLAAMSDALRQMPQYRELIGKYSLHMAIAQQCMDKHTQEGLEAVATTEQNMAMGEDAEGKAVNPLPALTQLMKDPSLPLMFKMRLLMVYIATQDGLREQDRRKLMELATIDASAASAIDNLQHMGVSLTKAPKKRIALPFKKEKRRKADEVSYDLFRFRPSVYFLGQDILDDKLAREEYPWVQEPIASASGVSVSVGGSRAAASARSRPKAGWALQGRQPREAERTFSGPRLIIFFLGGVTFSELRSAYELTKSTNREVLIGSTHTIIPDRYISELQRLSDAAAPPADH